MQNRNDNPYLAPQVMEAISQEHGGTAKSFSWFRWVVAGTLIQASVITMLVYFDSIHVVNDSGLWCCCTSVAAQVLACVLIGLRYEKRTAIQLSQVVNSIVWLTFAATAHVVVPRLLLIPIRHKANWIFLAIWAGGMLASALITLLSGKFRRPQPESEIRFDVSANDVSANDVSGGTA